MGKVLEVDTRAISEMFGNDIEKIIPWNMPNKYTVWYLFAKEDENNEVTLERRRTTLNDADLCELFEKAISCHFGDFDLRIGSPYEVIIYETSDDGSQTNGKEYDFSNITKLRVYCDVINSDVFKSEVDAHYELSKDKNEQNNSTN